MGANQGVLQGPARFLPMETSLARAHSHPHASGTGWLSTWALERSALQSDPPPDSQQGSRGPRLSSAIRPQAAYPPPLGLSVLICEMKEESRPSHRGVVRLG